MLLAAADGRLSLTTMLSCCRVESLDYWGREWVRDEGTSTPSRTLLGVVSGSAEDEPVEPLVSEAAVASVEVDEMPLMGRVVAVWGTVALCARVVDCLRVVDDLTRVSSKVESVASRVACFRDCCLMRGAYIRDMK